MTEVEDRGNPPAIFGILNLLFVRHPLSDYRFTGPEKDSGRVKASATVIFRWQRIRDPCTTTIRSKSDNGEERRILKVVD